MAVRRKPATSRYPRLREALLIAKRIIPHAVVVGLAVVGTASLIGTGLYVIGRLDYGNAVMEDRYSRYQDSLSDMKARLEKIEGSVQYRWTAKDMRLFKAKAEAANDGLRLPDIDEIMASRIATPIDAEKTGKTP